MELSNCQLFLYTIFLVVARLQNWKKKGRTLDVPSYHKLIKPSNDYGLYTLRIHLTLLLSALLAWTVSAVSQ